MANARARKPRQPATSSAAAQALRRPGATDAVSLLSRSQRWPALSPAHQGDVEVGDFGGRLSLGVIGSSLGSSWPASSSLSSLRRGGESGTLTALDQAVRTFRGKNIRGLTFASVTTCLPSPKPHHANDPGL